MHLQQTNTELKEKAPAYIVKWALSQARNPVITTNFRPYEVALLHLITQIEPDIKVIWCDTGYNTRATYLHVLDVTKRFNLNLHTYVPKQSAGFREASLGIPKVGTKEHEVFSEQVKLEPFRRAMQEHQPDFWFTNLRMGQTAFRNSIDVISRSKDGIIKVSPFYNYSDEELDEYLKEFNLPNELDYYDPTKVYDNRECGIHF